MSRSDALESWPYRPILANAEVPDGFRERFFQTNAEPPNEIAYLAVLYERPDVSSDSHHLDDVRAAGGVSAWIWFYPAGSEPDPGVWANGKDVQVRGRAAKMLESRTDEKRGDPPWVIGSNRHFRHIEWSVAVAGGTVVYEIGGDPDLYSEEELISIIDSMRELR